MQDKALFIDLDNTLITTRSNKKYPIHSEDWKFIPEVVDALQYYQKKGYKVIILSNQTGIEQGYVIEKAFISKMEKICKVLERDLKLPSQSIHYNYNNKDNYYTMPKGGMIHELAVDYELDISKSICIGSNETTSILATNFCMGYLSVVDVINIDWVNR